MLGLAAASWVIDLFKWAQGQPERQMERIIGLLLGYSPQAITAYDARMYAGRPTVQPKSS